jgi:hypothetical protein
MRQLAVLLLFAICTAAIADSWPSAKVRGVASPNGNIVVRVLPGDSLGDVMGFAGEKKGRPAQAMYYRLEGDRYIKYQEAPLLNPIAPVDFFVSDNGEIATLDNWHNMGIGKIVVVYAPDGTVRQSHELKEIYSQADLKKMKTSTSSIWWRCNSPPLFERGTVSFYDQIGNVVDVDLKIGSVTKPVKHKRC